MAVTGEIPSYLQPALADPFRKPTYPVVVDRSNPITQGLQGYNICQLSNGVAQGSNAQVSTGGMGEPGYSVNARTDAGFIIPIRTVTVNPLHSVFIVWSQTNFSTSIGEVLYSERPGGCQIFSILIRVGNTFTCTYRNNACGGLINQPVGPAVDTNRILHTGCLVKRADNARDLYCDGNTGSIATSSGGNYSDTNTTLCYDEQNLTAGADKSYIHAVYTWDRPLSPGEVKALEAAPYSIFKPANAFYFMTAAGATYTLTADPGTLQYNGTDTTLNYNRIMSADAGTLQYNGTAASLEFNRVLSADAGTLQYNGVDATLTYNAAGSYTLVADPGTLQYTGTAADLRYDRILSADAGTLQYNGVDATLARGWTVVADAGTLQYNGVDVSFDYGRAIVAEPGTLQYSGTNVTFDYSGAGLWTVQALDSTNWTVQSNDSTTWTIQ